MDILLMFKYKTHLNANLNLLTLLHMSSSFQSQPAINLG